MSGTSIDAVDYALCRVALERVELRRWWQVKFPKTLQGRLHAAARGEAFSDEVGQLHHDLGRFYVSGVARGLGRSKPQLIGLHGQTIFHQPNGKRPATFQLGEPAYLVEALRRPVVSNFRSADIAAGGEGAPLATLFHKIVFGKRGRHVCVNNLGGISNVTSIDWRHGRKPNLLAFDTGPANAPIDLATRYYSADKRSFDKNGAWAARGKVSEKSVSDWLAHAYFHQLPPKSTGRELFGELFFRRTFAQRANLSKYDAVASFTELTARSIALNYRLHLQSMPDEVVLTGGGAANRELVKRIDCCLAGLNPRIRIQTTTALGWPLQSVEPAAFALLAYYRWLKRPANIPQTTGAKHAVWLGQVAEP